jgi:hypothetical protein
MILLLNNLLDVVTAFVGLLTITLLLLSQLLLFLSQLLIMMLFLIWNGNTLWLRRLLLLNELACGVL